MKFIRPPAISAGPVQGSSGGLVGTYPRWALVLACMSLCSCIFLPQTTTRYDSDCGVVERHMSLQAYQIAAFGGCRNEGCVELLVVTGVVSAASLIVSGSVVVVGEAVYWLETKRQCLGK